MTRLRFIPHTGRVRLSYDLGCYDGPPIGTDDETIDHKNNAREGSAKLAARILEVFG